MTVRLLVLLALTATVAAAQTRLRIVAANLTSGNDQTYDPGHGQRILQALKPDIALIQEFRVGDNSDAALRRWVDATFGRGFHFHRERTLGAGDIPNGIVSRYPILAKDEWADPAAGNRDFAWARIDIPGNIDLYAVSVHLLTDDRRRPAQASNLAGLIAKHVPPAAYLVIGGDLNTDTARDRALQALNSVVIIPSRLPSDGTGRSGTNQTRRKPYDHVLADNDLDVHKTAVTVNGRTFPDGLVYDSRVFVIPPVQRADSAAPGMQHMAVVRDFLIPSAGNGGGIAATAEPRDTHENLHSTLWQQTAVEFRALCRQAFRIAGEQLRKALTDQSWTALPDQQQNPRLAQLPVALITDIDETILDNSPSQARAVKRNVGGFDRSMWTAWVNERRAEALPGALDFAALAQKLGVTIFYVTNRTEAEEPATRDNLTRLGFPVRDLQNLGPVLTDTLLTRGADSDKGARRAAVAAHYRVALLLGDDLGDFLSAVRTSVANRRAKAEPFDAMWGDRWIMLPNPSYGSWEGALTENRLGLPDAETLKIKRAQLREQ